MRFPADLIGCSKLKQLDFVCFNSLGATDESESDSDDGSEYVI